MQAQNKENTWAVGLMAVKSEYIGDIGNNVYNFKKNNLHFGGAVALERYLNRFFDVGFYASVSSFGIDKGICTYTDFEAWDNRNNTENTVKNFDVKTLTNLNLHTRFKFLGKDKFKLVPYIGMAVGMVYYNNISTLYVDADGRQQKMPYQKFYDNAWHDQKDKTAFALTASVGLEYRITKFLALKYQTDGSWTAIDDIDFYKKKSDDFQLQHNIGVVFSFNTKAKDRDGDGIPDYLDRCPKVAGDRDNDGCPRKLDTIEILTVPPIDTVVKVDTPVFEEPPVETVQKPLLSDTISFDDICFEFGKAELRIATAQNILDSIVGLMHDDTLYICLVEGHTDISGEYDFNKKLSLQRANAVKNYLLSKNIDPSLIIISACASDKPKYSNSTKDGREKNRRVEIRIVRGE
jgi:outer membrane protein OmpA-like peptidoglycan-associated protein/opacity protein-like surface antigen